MTTTMMMMMIYHIRVNHTDSTTTSTGFPWDLWSKWWHERAWSVVLCFSWDELDWVENLVSTRFLLKSYLPSFWCLIGLHCLSTYFEQERSLIMGNYNSATQTDTVPTACKAVRIDRKPFYRSYENKCAFKRASLQGSSEHYCQYCQECIAPMVPSF